MKPAPDVGIALLLALALLVIYALVGIAEMLRASDLISNIVGGVALVGCAGIAYRAAVFVIGQTRWR